MTAPPKIDQEVEVPVVDNTESKDKDPAQVTVESGSVNVGDQRGNNGRSPGDENRVGENSETEMEDNNPVPDPKPKDDDDDKVVSVYGSSDVDEDSGESESKESEEAIKQAEEEKARADTLATYPLFKVYHQKKGGFWTEPTRQWYVENPTWNKSFGSGWDYEFYTEQVKLKEIKDWIKENKLTGAVNFRDESFISSRPYLAKLMHGNARTARSVCDEFNELWARWVKDYEPVLTDQIGLQDFTVMEIFFHRLDKNPLAVAKHKFMGNPKLRPMNTVISTAELQASVAVLPGMKWMEKTESGTPQKNGAFLGDVVGTATKLEVVVAVILADLNDNDGVQNWYEFAKGTKNIICPSVLTIDIDDVYNFHNNKNDQLENIKDSQSFVENFHLNIREINDLIFHYYWYHDRLQQECCLMASTVYNYFTATDGGKVVCQRFLAKNYFDTIIGEADESSEESEEPMDVESTPGVKRSLDDVMGSSDAGIDAPAPKKSKPNTGGSTSSSGTPRSERRRNSAKQGLDSKSVEDLSLKLIRHGGGLATDAITTAMAAGNNQLVIVQKGVTTAMETAMNKIAKSGDQQTKRVGTKGMNALQEATSAFKKVNHAADRVGKLLDTVESKMKPTDTEEALSGDAEVPEESNSAEPSDALTPGDTE